MASNIARVLSHLKKLMADFFTGQVVLHISEGQIRKIETNEITRYE